MEDIRVHDDPSRLFSVFIDPTQTRDWFFMNILVGQLPPCPHDRIPMILRSDKNFHYFQCTRCTKKKSMLDGTVFSRSKGKLHVILLIILFGWIGIAASKTSILLGPTPDTVGFWYFVMRVGAMTILNDTPVVLGGPGSIVEIDEAIWRRRKYKRGLIFTFKT